MKRRTEVGFSGGKNNCQPVCSICKANGLENKNELTALPRRPLIAATNGYNIPLLCFFVQLFLSLPCDFLSGLQALPSWNFNSHLPFCPNKQIRSTKKKVCLGAETNELHRTHFCSRDFRGPCPNVVRPPPFQAWKELQLENSKSFFCPFVVCLWNPFASLPKKSGCKRPARQPGPSPYGWKRPARQPGPSPLEPFLPPCQRSLAAKGQLGSLDPTQPIELTSSIDNS